MIKSFLSEHKIQIAFLFVLFLAAFLRIYQLNVTAPSLSRDEVSVGFNAYSILKTGKDEYGRLLPLAFEALGDWKLPLDIYIAVPFVAIFGLTEIAVRLPVALFGIASVIVIYFLAEEIRKLFSKLLPSPSFPLLASFILAVSPWHIYMSRTAFGHNVIALFFLMLGLLFFLRSFRNPVNLVWSGLAFSATLFLYTSYHIFLPFFLVGLFWLFKKELLNNKFFKVNVLIIFFFYLVALITLWQANITKIPGSSVLNDAKMIYYRIERKQNEHKTDVWPAKIFHNKIIVIPQQIFSNYLSALSPQFLFDKGGENPINNIEEMGNLYFVDALFIILGIYFLIREKDKIIWLFLLWLLVSPLPGAITRDAPHSTRTFAMTGALALIEAYGIVKFIDFLSKQKISRDNFCVLLTKLTVPVIVILYTTSIVLFVESYFYHFPLNRARFWGYGFKQAVALSDKLQPQKVVMSKLYDSPYIFVLFYEKYSPDKYQKEAKRLPLTWDGFRPVAGFDKYEFVDRFDWNHAWDNQDTLYIDAVENIPKNYPINGWINYPFGDKAYGWFLTRGNPCRFVYPDRELTPKICR